MKIAFDIDDTLYKIVGIAPRLRQIPDYEVIQLLLLLHKFGAEIIVWSGGGVDYAEGIVNKLGLDGIVKVKAKGSVKVDLTFDDQDIKLGTLNFWIKR
jgi:hypothetical protein